MRVVITGGRRSGKTTKQMLAAPQGAVYVWPSAYSLPYARGLAKQLGRDDLQLMAASQPPERLRGLNGEIVMDHAAVEALDRRTFQQWEYAQRCQSLRAYLARWPAPDDSP